MSVLFIKLQVVQSWAAMFFVELKGFRLSSFDSASAISKGDRPLLER
jgi:hypothetical protein